MIILGSAADLPDGKELHIGVGGPIGEGKISCEDWTRTEKVLIKFCRFGKLQSARLAHSYVFLSVEKQAVIQLEELRRPGAPIK